MRLLAKKRYRQPFGLIYEFNDGIYKVFALDTVIGSEILSGPESGIGFLFRGNQEIFGSKEETEFTAAAGGIPTVYVGDVAGWYADCDKVQNLVAATNPDAVEI